VSTGWIGAYIREYFLSTPVGQAAFLRRSRLTGLDAPLLITSSTEARMSQFYIGSDPLWAWVCSVSDPQDSIKELLNCILRVIGRKRRPDVDRRCFVTVHAQIEKDQITRSWATHRTHADIGELRLVGRVTLKEVDAKRSDATREGSRRPVVSRIRATALVPHAACHTRGVECS